MQKRLEGTRLRAGAGDDEAVRRLAPVKREQLARYGLVMPLLLSANPIVVGVLSPPGPALVAVESLAPGTVGPEAGQLSGFVRSDLEEARAGAVEDDGEQPAELLLHPGELADQRGRVDAKA